MKISSLTQPRQIFRSSAAVNKTGGMRNETHTFFEPAIGLLVFAHFSPVFKHQNRPSQERAQPSPES